MIELRWLKGNYEFGKFKLQMRQRVNPTGPTIMSDWYDVPIALDKPKEKSLEDKFRYFLEHTGHTNESFCIESLAKIANDHFKGDSNYVS